MKSITANLFQKTMAQKEFDLFNDEQLFERLKLVSYMLIFTYPCFFIVDFVLFSGLDHPVFKSFLITIHLFGALISIIFIILYRRKDKLASKSFVVHTYVLLFLIIGAGSSINSQLFTKNIYAYIIIILGVAVILPINPRNLFIQYTLVQAGFLIALKTMEPNHFTYLSMLVNSTGTVVIAFTIALAFYTFRRSDFINRQRLSKSVESFQSLFNRNPKPLVLMKLADFEIILLNKQAIEYYQLPPKGKEPYNGSFLFPNLEERLEILTRLTKEKRIKNYVTEQQMTEDKKRWSLLHLELIEYLDTTCILIDTTDITEIKEKEAELFKHASIDILTGVRNRRCGIEIIREQLQQSQEFILCYIDINNLKIVNDTFGHSTGDDLIKTCCQVINSQLSSIDILFRIGGDEFIILFFKKQMEEVQQLWAQIELDFQTINQSQSKPYQLSASLGFYHYKPGTSITVEELLEHADQEMYKVKTLKKAHV
ncbi:GGDEF domain-containing protein [Bacillus sp. USDA818B3_A]|uniref:GGDEF domain-containing protein n=1 Tax=Bacillus sp. USDA818B3_A TaxID=2698834 RepID=UPI00136BF7F4|nr:GGDEF domain-containing protein [Bacillus sp. USDA818B3_A]